MQRLRSYLEDTTRRLVQAIGRIKRHRNPWVRRGVAGLLILGGLLGFLPVLGVWMLPLGLIILSDEVSWLRRFRRRVHVWLLARYRRVRKPS
ncbi:hypothetical protein DRB17_00470 [Ferruginivarius sediminum]|uniref:Tryptophan synthase subunit beta n=2 Tax=Ferruginivarius sediminum TaxID=2661937 RepID=A0A369TIH7_9PROT|nr:hypothetical protein DRB17_00470 [Ferruginivarius sediminum]